MPSQILDLKIWKPLNYTMIDSMTGGVSFFWSVDVGKISLL